MSPTIARNSISSSYTSAVLSLSLGQVGVDFSPERCFLFMKRGRRALVPKLGRNKINYFRERDPETVSFLDIIVGVSQPKTAISF